MESFKIENLSFAYPNREYKALDNINITVKQGEFVTLCGKSGCGKTTLLRLLKSSLAPFGDLNGNIYFETKPLTSYNAREQASKIGFVMQIPDNQIVTDKVWHEIAFCLESLGHKTPEIRARVSEMASFFGIDTWFYKDTSELSGGQKQLLNLASVMVMSPSVLILDEPTSQLDPISAQNFLKTLEKINRELGITVILTEHRLEDVFSMSDRVIVMDYGKVIANDTPRKVGEILKAVNHDMYWSLPTPIKVYNEVDGGPQCPVTVREGKKWLFEYAKLHKLDENLIPKPCAKKNNTIVEVSDIWFRYDKDLPDVIKGLNVKIQEGETFAILGGNGSGKTTLLSLISGINKPYRGKILINNKDIFKINNLYNELISFLPQNPQSVFIKNTVKDDLLEIISEEKLTTEKKNQKIKDIASICRIENLLAYHPYDLSGGEQQRAALAKILLKNPKILLLDEPTKGMDTQFKEEFADILNQLKQNGVTIIIVSHDIEFCAQYADRCALVFDGIITSSGLSREFFSGKNFYTTTANRMARAILKDAVLPDDIILACGKKIKRKEKKDITTRTPAKKSESTSSAPVEPKQKISKHTLFSVFLILLTVPLTIYLGSRFLDVRKYYFISLLIIIQATIPFLMVFESRKPRARELVTISTLCAIAVAARAAFFMLPQFKPTVAIIIISAICLGGQTGFLIGIVTGFISNFFFGQGPWTPWQMFALGIIGFISGILFKKGFIRNKKIPLCIFGFIITFILYGCIMNSSSVILSQQSPTLKMFIAAFISGMPFDLIHAGSTAFFLWFMSDTMIDKLKRIKIKYGLIK